jgi:hypothetical protein
MSSFLITFLSFLISLIGVQAIPTSLRPRDLSCNGSPALCDRIYSNITFIGTHDSAFVGSLPTQNQIKSVTDQLNSGIRFLQAQTHKWLNGFWMCHTSCLEVNATDLLYGCSAMLTCVGKWRNCSELPI